VIPIRKTCSCGKPFDAVTPNQDQCLSCLLKPSRKDDRQKLSLLEVNTKLSERTCECGCGEQYQPTGPRQKIRKECADRLFKEKVARKLDKIKPIRVISERPAVSPAPTVCEYDLLFAEYAGDLSKKINEKLGEGWALYFGPTSTDRHLYQAITRQKPLSTEV
jgi:hypothetical protein